MVKYVYCGLYDINLHGETYAEFDGEHPTMIIQTKKEPNICFVVPFTSYTDDRWKKLKKKMCCRVESTNSIARIDRMKIINDSDITKRWISSSTKSLLIVSKEDAKKVLDKALAYVSASFDMNLKSYGIYHDEREHFVELVNHSFVNYDLNGSIFSFNFSNEHYAEITFSKDYVKHLAKIDIQDTFNRIFQRRNIVIIISDTDVCLQVKKTDSGMLTFKEKYDSINSTEG